MIRLKVMRLVEWFTIFYQVMSFPFTLRLSLHFPHIPALFLYNTLVHEHPEEST